MTSTNTQKGLLSHCTPSFQRHFSVFVGQALENLAQVGATAHENKGARATQPLNKILRSGILRSEWGVGAGTQYATEVRLLLMTLYAQLM